MNRFWLDSYPPGVPADIDPALYPSLVDLLEESFGKYRQRDAYVCMDRRLTFGELDELSRSFAAYLQGLGLNKGDRVAIMMPNVLQYPVVVAAVLRAGLIAVNVNPLYTARELEHQLKDSGAIAIVVLENFAATLQAAIAGTAVKHVVVASMGDLLGWLKGTIVNFVVRHVRRMVPAFSLPGHVRFNAAMARGHGQKLAKPALAPSDVAVLQYTGGTTGVAKGATLLHQTIVANLLASDAWLQPALRKKPPSGQLTIVCALPLYHVFAFVTCSLLGLRTGAMNILIPNPRDLPGTIKELAKYRMNIFPAVNTLFNGLLNRPEFARLDFSGLAVSNGGGMAVQEAVAKKWLEVTGCPICEGYGLSETSSGVTCNPTDSDTYTGTIGLPLPSVEIKLLDDNGNEAKPGEHGEIAIRGPQVMRDYWQRPADTEEAFTADGFFRSGDIGTMDGRGFIRIVDRKKDMIIVSGFKVYPNEIEDVVAHHPGVLECAAVGVPDKNSGEAVTLFVVRRDPNLTKEELADYCTKNFTPYKRPKIIEFSNELPKTNVGKILRRDLREQPAKQTA